MSFAQSLDRLRAAKKGARALPHHKTAVLVSDLAELLNQFDRLDTAIRSGHLGTPHAILNIGEFLLADRKDNDHCTADPIFTVQKLHRVTGLDTDYCENVIWLDCENDHSEADARTAKALEVRHASWNKKVPDRWIRTGYRDEWRHVASYFTRTAAEAFIEGRKHEGEMRVYVDSAHRNHEWREVQQHLMALARESLAAAP